jgi:predicted transcriptional regulator
MSLISQYMNRTLVYLRDGDRAAIALGPILELGLTTIPILDYDYRPVGVISLRELVNRGGAPPQIVSNVKTITAEETVETAARVLARENIHHLIVVDPSGVAVGMLSSLDVVRALAGLPPHQPEFTRLVALGAGDEVQGDLAM